MRAEIGRFALRLNRDGALHQHAGRARVRDRAVRAARTEDDTREDERGEGTEDSSYPSHESAACNKKSLTLRPRSKMSQSGSSPLAT